MTDTPIYIRISDEPADLPVGSSHWFGYPDLPPDMEIPYVEEDGEAYALTLLCQINLADLPENDALPRQGLLLLFADVAYYAGNWDEPSISMHMSDNKACRAIFVPAERMGEIVSRREEYAEQDEAGARAMTFGGEPTSLAEPELQILGSTDRLEWETWPAPCEGWQLLLLMDSMEGSDYNYNFVDCGALCLVIDPERLRRADFSDVRAIILST